MLIRRLTRWDAAIALPEGTARIEPPVQDRDSIVVDGVGPANRLTVTHRAGDAGWVEIAWKYRTASLSGLTDCPSARTAVVHRGEAGSPPRPCYFKQYLARDWLDPIKNLVRPSRARRAWHNAQLCRGLGFAVPRPLCLMEERRWGMLTFCALITEAVEDAPDVATWLRSPQAAGRNWKYSLLRGIGREVARWHAAGLYHGDPHAGNLLYRATPDAGTFFWLDCERTRRYRHLPPGRRVNDLMKLNYDPLPLSLTDRMRVWKAYADASRLTPKSEKDLLRRVLRRTQRRWRKRGWL